MISGVSERGYTIVEVLIFLAVSAALMVSALSMVGGQQRRTEFSQAVREVDSRLSDIINDVSTGFYPNTGDISCEYFPTPPNPRTATGITFPSGSPAAQGSNQDCIFVGRIIQFAPEGMGGSSMRVYTVAGKRQVVDGSVRREPTSLSETKAKLIAKDNPTSTTPDSFEDIANNPAITIGRVCYDACGPNHMLGGIGVFTTFGSYSGNALQSGTTTAQLAPIVSTPTQPSNINQPPYEFVRSVNEKLSGTIAPWSDGDYRDYVNKAQEHGITICLLSQGTDQHARIKIGGDFRRLTTEVSFHNGNQLSDCPG